MKESDTSNDWAWSQIEAMADGSLSADDQQRMRRAIGNDAQLERAVERAKAVRQALRRLPPAPIPRGLSWRLLGINAGSSRQWLWFGTPALATTIAILVAVMLIGPDPVPIDPRAAALEDFRVAMHYLQRTAVFTSNEVTGTVGDGLREAVTTSRDARRDEELRSRDGG